MTKRLLLAIVLWIASAFGILIGVQTVTDLWVWEELFERNYVMQVRL
jgi:hypothetical protein